jgi:hypothetical protein
MRVRSRFFFFKDLWQATFDRRYLYIRSRSRRRLCNDKESRVPICRLGSYEGETSEQRLTVATYLKTVDRSRATFDRRYLFENSGTSRQ